MLSIQPSKAQKCTPNLLPARINHNGPIASASQYWKPSTDDKGTQHAYFRGRHFYGTTLPLPGNYAGAVLIVTDKLLPQPRKQAPAEQTDQDDDDESLPVEIKVAEQIGEFGDVVVWGHGGDLDGEDDMFVRGMREWVGFAESIHVDGDDEDEESGKKGV